jgi:hypothetical protein
MLLRTAMEAASRGGHPDESYTRAVEAGVATLFPSEARRFAQALEVLLGAAQRVAEAQEVSLPRGYTFTTSPHSFTAHEYGFELLGGDNKGLGSCSCGWDTGDIWCTESDAEVKFGDHL